MVSPLLPPPLHGWNKMLRYFHMIRDELSLATDGLEDVELTVSGWLHRWRDRDVYLWGSPK